MNDPRDFIGTAFHGITLLAYCGGGAFGDVYYGRDVTGRGLAVKIIPKARRGEHWERELKGVVQYRRITEKSPELLKLFHVEDAGDEFFYTMEPADPAEPGRYLPDTLASRLTKGAIPPEDLFGILSGIFAGLRAIHEAGFVHRDVKPENILFVDGVPKLGDIGLVSSLSSSMTTLVGTLEYIPPEMRTAEHPDADRADRCRCDLYAFGKVVYCAVTGQDAGRWPALPPQLPDVLPVKLFLRLALRLCNQDPVRRIGTVGELGREFADIDRQLRFGETWRDRARYRRRELLANARGLLHDLGRGLRRYWYAVLIALAVLSGAVWYAKTQTVPAINASWSKKYEFKPAGVEMILPLHWEPFSRQTLQKFLKDRENRNLRLTDHQKQLLDLMEVFLQYQKNISLICCDFDPDCADTIMVQTLPPTKPRQYDLSDKQLAENVKKGIAPIAGPEVTIERIRRLRLAGHPCLEIVYRPGGARIHVRNLTWEFADRMVSIVLTAKGSTLAERGKEFETVLKTLKIREKL